MKELAKAIVAYIVDVAYGFVAITGFLVITAVGIMVAVTLVTTAWAIIMTGGWMLAMIAIVGTGWILNTLLAVYVIAIAAIIAWLG